MSKWSYLKAGLFLLLLTTIGNAHARFVSVDPVQADANSGQNFNRYHYANNNPYKFTDPDGRCPMPGSSLCGKTIETIQAQDAAQYRGEPTMAGKALGVAIDFSPGVGDAKGIMEAVDNPTPGNVIGAAVGLIPVGGDLLKGAIKHSDDIAGAARAAPDFIVSPGGTAFPVPKGATGPTPVINPAGKQTGVAFTGGQGGANGQVSTMRVMDPTSARGASPGYPNGYIKYENAGRQGVDPYSGKTLPNSQSHYPIDRP